MRVLIRFAHSATDAAQFTVVLQHLRACRPDWSVDVQAFSAAAPAFRGLCRRVFTRHEERDSRYDSVFDLAWPEPERSYGTDIPATKAERCLREVFQIEPRSDLCQAAIAVGHDARELATALLESLTPPTAERFFPVLLLRCESDAVTPGSPIHIAAAEVCRLARDAGCVPVILDLDEGSSKNMVPPGVARVHAKAPIWANRTPGDAEVVAALASLSRLCVDLGKPHACLAASGAPTISAWTERHPIHEFGPHEDVLHVVPVDHERLIRGGALSQVECGRTFFESYRFATYNDRRIVDALLQEVGRALRGTRTIEPRTLVAYSFCAAHRKSNGLVLSAADHWRMLATAMDAWNNGRSLPELLSVVGALAEPVPEEIAGRAAIVASPANLGHQLGAGMAIQQAALYARHHGFERLVFVADDVLPISAGAQELAQQLDGADYAGSYWTRAGELNTQVFAVRVRSLFDGDDLRLQPSPLQCLEARMAAAMKSRNCRLDHHLNRDYFHTHGPDELTRNTATERRARHETSENVLLAHRWIYARLGYDARPMRFEKDAARRWIGEGRAPLEERWWILWNEARGDWGLQIFGEHGTICELYLAPGPRWVGQWFDFEQMPIVLSPIGGRKTNAPPTDQRLERLYGRLCGELSDITAHLPTLRRLAAECDRVTELGTREGRSTTALLSAQPNRLVSIDINDCRNEGLIRLAGHTQLEFVQSDSRFVDMEPTDLLFVDTWHTGEQLAAELARHADKVARIMAFHDTQSFGEIGEDGTSRGLRPALDEFLAAHDEWYLAEEYRHENGLTVLRRVDDGSAGSETQHKKVERQMPEKIQNPEFQI